MKGVAVVERSGASGAKTKLRHQPVDIMGTSMKSEPPELGSLLGRFPTFKNTVRTSKLATNDYDSFTYNSLRLKMVISCPRIQSVIHF